MEQEIVESIQNFENKKEFRAVKLFTRDSFREDQAALDRRLSKYRGKSDHRMSDGYTGGTQAADTERADNHVNGHENKAFVADIDQQVTPELQNGSSGVTGVTKLEEVVLDIDQDTRDGDNMNTSASVGPSASRENSAGDSFFFTGIDIPVSDKQPTQNGGDNQQNRVRTVSTTPGNSDTSARVNGVNRVQVTHTNDHVTHQHVSDNGHTSSHVIVNGSVPNGHMYADSVRPKVNGQGSGSLTPEPRLKLLKGIYQKNPKLTSGSTDHLDNISLKGSIKSGPRPQEVQQIQAPLVPAAELTSLPADGNLLKFSVPQMVTIFRLMRLPGDLIYKLSRSNVDGKRFAMFSDQELEDLGMGNPIIKYFRDRSAQTVRRPKRKPIFTL